MLWGSPLILPDEAEAETQINESQSILIGGRLGSESGVLCPSRLNKSGGVSLKRRYAGWWLKSILGQLFREVLWGSRLVRSNRTLVKLYGDIMSGECYFDDNCWHESKIKLPPLGEVIEGTNPKDWLYSKLGRDYFALVEINSKLTWITPSLVDMDYEELRISHWRHIPPDYKNKKPFIKIKKFKGYWEPKLWCL